MKKVFGHIWAELLNHVWFYAAAIASMFDLKEMALSLLLLGIYFKVSNVLEILAVDDEAPIITLHLEFPKKEEAKS